MCRSALDLPLGGAAGGVGKLFKTVFGQTRTSSKWKYQGRRSVLIVDSRIKIEITAEVIEFKGKKLLFKALPAVGTH